MAQMSMDVLRAVLRISFATIVLVRCVASLLLLFVTWRMPFNDLRLWRLERSFQAASYFHPHSSFLLDKKKYLGGPYNHGSFQCDFFVGELRSAPLSQGDVQSAYEDRSVAFLGSTRSIPLKILFFEKNEPWPMYLPLSDWWDEWYVSPLNATSSTVYLIYMSQEGRPYVGDFRCDD